MLVCSCNFISAEDIRQAVTALLEEDEWQLIVPLKVYRALGKRGRCCGCFPEVADIIAETTEAYRRSRQEPEAQARTQFGHMRSDPVDL